MNANGQIEPDEWSIIWSPTGGTAAFQVKDDGTSPGDGTPQNAIKVGYTFSGTSESTMVNVKNIAPVITSEPQVLHQITADNKLEVTVSVNITDPGVYDDETLTVKWSDGVESTVVIEGDRPGALFTSTTRTLKLTRVVAGSTTIKPVSLEVKDDDSGVATYEWGSEDISINNDNDNGLPEIDLVESGVNDPDINQLDLSHVRGPMRNLDEGHYALSYDMNTIRLWDSAAKETLIASSWAGRLGAQFDIGGNHLVNVASYSGQANLWVEGISPGRTTIKIFWQSNKQQRCDAELTGVTGQTDVRVWGIDLDIDSDNNNGLDPPDYSPWEEEIESHPFSIGKLIELEAIEFTPIVLKLPVGLDVNDESIEVEITNTNAGFLSIWFNPRLVKKPEDLLSVNRTYKLKQLPYDPISGNIRLYCEALDARYSKMIDIAIDGVGEHILSARLLINEELFEDSVKYKVVEQESFFPRYIAERAWRNAVAADLVYGDRGAFLENTPPINGDPKDGQQYAQRFVREDELTIILDRSVLTFDEKKFVLDVIFHHVRTAQNPGNLGEDELRVALYRDWNSGDYTLSFQGTNFYALEDWLTNLAQSIGARTDEYEAAQLLAFYIGKVNFQGLQISGQSLGGGLASAASIASGIHADTFNAAGVTYQTFFKRVDGLFAPVIPGSKPLARLKVAGDYVTAYRVWFSPTGNEPSNSERNVPDVLTFFQEQIKGNVAILNFSIPLLPDAIGDKVDIEGLFNVDTLSEKRAMNLGWIPWLLYDGLENTIFEMGMSHQFPSIYYGLMHGFEKDGKDWNVYDYEPAR